jgi:hypothetical protein
MEVQVTINEQIVNVEGYFKNKILNEDYVTIDIDEHIYKLQIDNKYTFTLWIGNIQNIKDSVKLYENGQSYIDVKFNQKERIKLRGNILPLVKKETIEKALSEINKRKRQLEVKLEKLC